MKRATTLRLGALAAVLLLPYLLLRVPAARERVVTFVTFVRTAGPAGALALFGFYTVWALAGGPYWIMAVVAGYAFGFPLGVAFTIPAGTGAMCVSFLLGRTFLTHVLPRREPDSPKAAAVRRAIEADGLKVAFLLRITPLVPQNALTYVLASTALRLRDFALATAVGVLPLTVFYAYVGSLVQDAAALLAGDTPDLGATKWIVLGGGLVLGGLALFVIGRLARKALSRAMDAT